MGVCRFWVYIIAGATGVDGLNGYPIFCGAALALYIVGLSYVARRESRQGPVPYWPMLFLAAPILLALAMNTGTYRTPAVWVAVVLALWIILCVSNVLAGGEINVGWTVSNLLSGIVFVDWLAVAPEIPHFTGAVVFLALFGATKWFQRFVPAT
jgi:4-hydroxybenzoate polyprenyltransferase